MPECISKFHESLLNDEVFSVTWELVPGRGAFERNQATFMASAEQAAKGGRVHALTITDNPGGNPALSAEMLANELKQLDIEPLVQRLKRYGEEGSLAACQVPPVDHRLRHTSSWLNYYMGRDHAAKRMVIESPSRKDDGDFGR